MIMIIRKYVNYIDLNNFSTLLNPLPFKRSDEEDLFQCKGIPSSYPVVTLPRA